MYIYVYVYVYTHLHMSCVAQICESYLQLDDWQDVIDWQDTLQQYRSEHTGTALYRAFTAPYDMNYIK